MDVSGNSTEHQAFPVQSSVTASVIYAKEISCVQTWISTVGKSMLVMLFSTFHVSDFNERYGLIK